ncbi:MAG: hypothetical protein JWQ97_933, partial [Phenylobacterium sp.]|nr:hypothetical protein [Phenylobacterium sp.]
MGGFAAAIVVAERVERAHHVVSALDAAAEAFAAR